MGNLATSQKTSQKTVNQQVGVNGENASGASASGSVGKAGSQAVGNGISLVFNTGGNKITAPKAPKAPKTKKGAAATTTPPIITATGQSTVAPSSDSQGSGDIKVNISQTDQGAVAAGTNVSLEAIGLVKAANDALLQSNTNATALAMSALQTGADIAVVAIPTYAAAEIASNAINPPNFIDGTGPVASAPSLSRGEVLAILGIVVTLAIFAGKKHA